MLYIIIISGNDEALISDANGTSGENTNTKTKPAKISLRSSLLSLTCILHLYWLFVHALRFVTFIGFLNQWLLESLGNTEEFLDIVVREKKGEVEATQCNIIEGMQGITNVYMKLRNIFLCMVILSGP